MRLFDKKLLNPVWKPQRRANLGLYSNFESRASNGQRVAHDDEDVPSIDKLHAVRPCDHFVEVGVEEYSELLYETESTSTNIGFTTEMFFFLFTLS